MRNNVSISNLASCCCLADASMASVRRSNKLHRKSMKSNNNTFPCEQDERMVSRPMAQLNTQPFELQYRLGSVLGEGGFGKVYSAHRLCDNKPVAVKQVPRSKVPTWGVVSVYLFLQCQWYFLVSYMLVIYAWLVDVFPRVWVAGWQIFSFFQYPTSP